MSKSSITHQDFFVIRTPRLPVNQFFLLGETTTKTREVIYTWLEKPEAQEALYLATPSLLARYNSHLAKVKANRLDDSLTSKQKKTEIKQTKKLEQALLKYLLRMCARPTPFGLFSGIHQGKIAEETQFISASLLKIN